METHSLRGLFSRFKSGFEMLEDMKLRIQTISHPVEKVHLKKQITMQENLLQHLNRKINQFGEGAPSIQVSGLMRVATTLSQFSSVQKEQKFVFFLYGVTLEEAKLIMKAQVIKNHDLIEESLSYATIEFKQFIKIS